VTDCVELEPVLQALMVTYGWRCRRVPGDVGVLEVSTGRRQISGEPVRLRVRVEDNGAVVASDGGESLLRLVDAGLDRGDPAMMALWTETLRTYRLKEYDDRVYVEAPAEEAAHALNRLADALVALDGLSLVCVPPQTRSRTLTDEVESYLRQRYENHVRRMPSIQLAGGLSIKPSMAVDTPDRDGIVVQTGAASDRSAAYEHAFTLFSKAARGGLPIPKRLVILGGQVGTWSASDLRILGDVAFVGFRAHIDLVLPFLEGKVPDDTILTPTGVSVPLLPPMAR
jgi:hypothetical protein